MTSEGEGERRKEGSEEGRHVYLAHLTEGC